MVKFNEDFSPIVSLMQWLKDNKVSAAARKKGAPRARMSLPAEAEPHQNDQINEHKACKHVHDDFFLSIVSGRPTQTSESVPAATTT
jgi:hypothetical protein